MTSAPASSRSWARSRGGGKGGSTEVPSGIKIRMLALRRAAASHSACAFSAVSRVICSRARSRVASSCWPGPSTRLTSSSPTKTKAENLASKNRARSTSASTRRRTQARSSAWASSHCWSAASDPTRATIDAQACSTSGSSGANPIRPASSSIKRTSTKRSTSPRWIGPVEGVKPNRLKALARTTSLAATVRASTWASSMSISCADGAAATPASSQQPSAITRRRIRRRARP